MQVNVISDTIQEFAGLRYWRCGKYFQRYGRRLHIAVWSAANGSTPPKGYHVHHGDEDRSNNQPDNLELIHGSRHMSHHHKGVSRTLAPSAYVEAAKWHGSEAGIEWHRQHFERHGRAKLHVQREFSCEQCGQKFVTQDNGHNRFCSNGCKTRYRFLSGVDDVTRSCVICSAEFVVNRYRKRTTCGPACHGTLSGNTRRRS